MIIKTTAWARLDYEWSGAFKQAKLPIFDVFVKPEKLRRNRLYLLQWVQLRKSRKGRRDEGMKG
jgi:hypothetical protein